MSRKQGLPERGSGAPCIHGDLTAKADMGGRQTCASVSGRIPIKSDVAPAPPHRPPHVLGMRPAAIAFSHRSDEDSMTRCGNEVAA
jgi:hypothetical protein